MARAKPANAGRLIMGTTNQKQYTPKEAKKVAEDARKQAESKGWQSMAYKFSAPKGKK